MLLPLSFRRRHRQELRAYAYLWPALVLLGLLMVWPLVQVVRMSFFEVTLQQQRFVGLANYGELLATPLFWRALMQTVLFTAGSVLLHLVTGLGLALLLHTRINARFIAAMRGALIIPWLLAPTVAGMIWVLMLAPFGVVNGLLMSLHLLDPGEHLELARQPRHCARGPSPR
jgi:multiple sugar transport system permease protein